MRPQTTSQTGVGNSDTVRLDYRQKDFKVGFGVATSGTVTYTIQHSFDDPADFASDSDYNTNATWFDNDASELVDATADQDGNYAFPVQSSRVEVTVGSGTATAIYLQGS